MLTIKQAHEVVKLRSKSYSLRDSLKCFNRSVYQIDEQVCDDVTDSLEKLENEIEQKLIEFDENIVVEKNRK